jgi:hypothetical protein
VAAAPTEIGAGRGAIVSTKEGGGETGAGETAPTPTEMGAGWTVVSITEGNSLALGVFVGRLLSAGGGAGMGVGGTKTSLNSAPLLRGGAVSVLFSCVGGSASSSKSTRATALNLLVCFGLLPFPGGGARRAPSDTVARDDIFKRWPPFCRRGFRAKEQALLHLTIARLRCSRSGTGSNRGKRGRTHPKD